MTLPKVSGGCAVQRNARHHDGRHRGVTSRARGGGRARHAGQPNREAALTMATSERPHLSAEINPG
jgi:hypothetical protein